MYIVSICEDIYSNQGCTEQDCDLICDLQIVSSEVIRDFRKVFSEFFKLGIEIWKIAHTPSVPKWLFDLYFMCLQEVEIMY